MTPTLWDKTGDRRDVRQLPFVEKLGNTPSVPGFHRPRVSPQGRLFAKNAKDGAPRCVGDASEIKSLGRPPDIKGCES
jgi:hypothetical protein